MLDNKICSQVFLHRLEKSPELDLVWSFERFDGVTFGLPSPNTRPALVNDAPTKEILATSAPV